MKTIRKPDQERLTRQRVERAAILARCGSLEDARSLGMIPRRMAVTLSEALVLGLLQQGVHTYFTVLGHGSTEMGEVLRVYQEAGLLRVLDVRSEIEASHAAAALRWVSGQKAAVLTSIGPGALHALAASLVPASNGIGVWYLFGDETSEDEGYNMQQVPKHEQGSFLQLAAAMGRAYCMHTPMALSSALGRGAVTVDHPTRAAPFYLLLPMNLQAAWLANFNLDDLPNEQVPPAGAAAGDYAQAAAWIGEARRIVVKVGGGGRHAGEALTDLLERTGAVLVHTPVASGCIPYDHPANMSVGGSKGSICGNYAMDHADMLIAIGTRAVCQSDSSRTGYPQVKRVININADLEDAMHYRATLALVGDVRLTLELLNEKLGTIKKKRGKWLSTCAAKKADWQAFKQQRRDQPTLEDAYWGETVLTQPAAIAIAADWAKARGALSFYDAGDVQANGFQIVEDETPDQTFTDTGASYMGFAVSALLASAAAEKPFYGVAFSGDGSLTMNPQVLIDGAEHGAHGCILLLDNGRMGAITGLQEAQYGRGFATWNTIKVDYRKWAEAVPGVLALDGGRTPGSLQAALEAAGKHPGLSLIHVPVYYGPDPLGGMGVYGRWNVGPWSDAVQALRHEIGL